MSLPQIGSFLKKLTIAFLSALLNFPLLGFLYSNKKISKLFWYYYLNNKSLKAWESDTQMVFCYFLVHFFISICLTFLVYWIRSLKPRMSTKMGTFKIAMVFYCLTQLFSCGMFATQIEYPYPLIMLDAIIGLITAMTLATIIHSLDWSFNRIFKKKKN
ncbi:hypothetical protein M0813_26356 [Anaeramoeba flamelloides]|uniref:Tic20 family protein Ycf60 n=1 Tax=Anaeramoeba flamelloides TaxID=1746091 RepID=A0AAV7Z3Z6_9EUKA|nr:hypothetical protein M0812_17839 [Anaeramoeba flamelloides]KAJ6238386.1 hypothetical protein M0813_26356 [Anaeramoeba flamelloides]